MSKSVRHSSEMTNTLRWPIHHMDKSICGSETMSTLSVIHTSGSSNPWKNYSTVNMSKSACSCPVLSLASKNEAEAHCHLLRMQKTINSWSLGTSSTVAVVQISQEISVVIMMLQLKEPWRKRKTSSSVSRLSSCGRRGVWPMPVSFEDLASIASGELFHTSTHRFNMSISTTGVSEPRMKRWELVQKEISYLLSHSSNPHGTPTVPTAPT